MKRLSRRQKYFIKQKLYGIVSVLLGLVSPYIMDGDATFGIILILGGLMLMFTKDMAIDDKYAREIKARREQRERLKGYR